MKLFITLILFTIVSIGSFAGNHDNWIKVGEAHMARRDFSQAVYYYTKAIEENPDMAKPYLLRAKAYLSMNKYLEARQDKQTAMTVDPSGVIKFLKKKSTTTDPPESINQSGNN